MTKPAEESAMGHCISADVGGYFFKKMQTAVVHNTVQRNTNLT